MILKLWVCTCAVFACLSRVCAKSHCFAFLYWFQQQFPVCFRSIEFDEFFLLAHASSGFALASTCLISCIRLQFSRLQFSCSFLTLGEKKMNFLFSSLHHALHSETGFSIRCPSRSHLRSLQRDSALKLVKITQILGRPSSVVQLQFCYRSTSRMQFLPTVAVSFRLALKDRKTESPSCAVFCRKKSRDLRTKWNEDDILVYEMDPTRWVRGRAHFWNDYGPKRFDLERNAFRIFFLTCNHRFCSPPLGSAVTNKPILTRYHELKLSRDVAVMSLVEQLMLTYGGWISSNYQVW